MDIIHEKLLVYTIGIVLGHIIGIAILIWSWRLAEKRRTAQDNIKLLGSRRAEFDNAFPVRYSSERKFPKFWKFAGEATGIQNFLPR